MRGRTGESRDPGVGPGRSLLPPDHRRESFLEALRSHLGLLLLLVAIPWGVEIFDWVMPGSTDGFGIRPRRIAGLPGIAAMPFLHGGFGHLVSNTLSFLLLGGLVLLGGRRLFLLASLCILALGGAALWTLGPSGTNHIGASLLIFGYLGFILARGLIERSLVWTLVAVGVFLLYGGMIAGVFPGERGVSWQGHLAGFVAGILCAKILVARRIG